MIKDLRWIMVDAISHCIGVASRCEAATEGTDDSLTFAEVRDLLFDLRNSAPMSKLSRSAMNEMAKSMARDRVLAKLTAEAQADGDYK